MGIVAARLLADAPDALAEEIREGLLIYCEGLRIEAQRADTELAEILGLLAARGLPAMPFKGPLLAHSAYSDPSLRPCLDLDSVVHADDVAHGLDALLAAGFVHEGGVSHKGIAALRRYAGEYILCRDESFPVEPHWLPAPSTLAF